MGLRDGGTRAEHSSVPQSRNHLFWLGERKIYREVRS